MRLHTEVEADGSNPREQSGADEQAHERRARTVRPVDDHRRRGKDPNGQDGDAAGDSPDGVQPIDSSPTQVYGKHDRMDRSRMVKHQIDSPE
ncbi:MAG: hypothetical protein L0H79_03235 [Intrasporangium sp.]|uniref:hypothetical protein n=1 Tax=Intrasporangium sp. TaxID=1925024 RepID=UPI00264A358D|nr:hypothetical protein [Intrasporangium sp.]MDN5794749.1 hypothetical protein [Intrasporangium sp.]